MSPADYILPPTGDDLSARLVDAFELGSACLREAEVESMEVVLHPSRSGDVALGVREHLDSMLLKFNEEYGGVVLGYRQAKGHGRQAPILRGLNPHIRLAVSSHLLLFSPEVGDKLRGTVNCVGADFVGLLVLGIFNVTVSDQHLQGFKFLKDKNIWKSRSNSKHKISPGVEVQAEIVSVQESGHMLDIRASLDALGTGSVKWLANGTK